VYIFSIMFTKKMSIDNSLLRCRLEKLFKFDIEQYSGIYVCMISCVFVYSPFIVKKSVKNIWMTPLYTSKISIC
jgi:hypothetical protein